MSRREDLIDLALSPASMELKRRLREGEVGGEALSVDFSPKGSFSTELILAWLYWLCDGVPAGVKVRPRTEKTGLEARLALRATGNGSILFQHGSGEDEGGLSIDGTPTAIPEGDGKYYRALEVEEVGESRMLPDPIIDEAVEFGDSLSEVFHENRPILL